MIIKVSESWKTGIKKKDVNDGHCIGIFEDKRKQKVGRQIRSSRREETLNI